MAIKPMQKNGKTGKTQKKKSGSTASGKGGGAWGGGMSMSMAQMQMAEMYYMKGMQKGMKGMGKMGKKGGMPMYGMYGTMPSTVMYVPKGYGKGKGVGKGKKPLSKFQEKLKKVPAERLVWVGNLSPKTKWKALEAHFAEVVKPTVSDIKERKNKEGKITAMVAFKTAEDVEAVVAALNGSELDGQALEVDKWEKSEKSKDGDGEDKPKRKRARGGMKHASKMGKVMNLKFAKGMGTRDEKTMAKMKAIDTSLKVWVGGMSEKTTKQALSKHFADVAKPKLVDMMRKGKAVVAYEKEEDAVAAIAAMNGTELDGKTIEVDAWTKSEKKPREKKGKKGEAKEEEA